jgi:hypothetical protein
MVLKCQQCGGKSVRFDRSLGGRAVCAACGNPMVENAGKSNRRQKQYAGITLTRPRQSLTARTALAWLLPLGLIGCHLYLRAHPRAGSQLLAPYTPASKEAWEIKAPADTELLIDQAQRGDREEVDPSLHATIRQLIARLQVKGVRLLISNKVAELAGGEWDPNLGEIRIRPSTVMAGSRALAEALAHESAHVSQSCRAGGLAKGSEPMGIEVNTAADFKRQLDSPLYHGPPASKAVELEAYSVGANPPWAVMLLDYYCKS